MIVYDHGIMRLPMHVALRSIHGKLLMFATAISIIATRLMDVLAMKRLKLPHLTLRRMTYAAGRRPNTKKYITALNEK